MIGLQAGQLLVQQRVKVLRLLDLPHRTFGGQEDLFPVAVLQRQAGHPFAFTIEIVVGCVHIVQALVNRPAQIGNRSLHIHSAVLFRQAHHTEAQRRDFQTGRTKRSILHGYTSFLICIFIIA